MRPSGDKTNSKARPNPNNTHTGEGGRIFEGEGKVSPGGAKRGHDLLNSDSSLSGVGSGVSSPAEARRLDETRNVTSEPGEPEPNPEVKE